MRNWCKQDVTERLLSKVYVINAIIPIEQNVLIDSSTSCEDKCNSFQSSHEDNQYNRVQLNRMLKIVHT